CIAHHVGFSTGGGEVVRYISRHGSKRVAKAVLIGAIPPLMLKTATNPGGLPLEVDGLVEAGSSNSPCSPRVDRPAAFGVDQNAFARQCGLVLATNDSLWTVGASRRTSSPSSVSGVPARH